MRSYDVAFSPTGGHEYRDVLERIHAAWFSGERLPAQPRPVIRDSWSRLRRHGIHPAKDGLPGERVERNLTSEPAPEMLELLPMIRTVLDPLLFEGQALLVLADVRGTVLWRGGASHLLRRADALRFQPGGSWAENDVGTNAIGTALATGVPVHVHAAEHLCVAHHQWSCAAAPVIDPRTMSPLGVIDLSAPAQEAQPSAVALAASLARQASWQLREEHRRELCRLEQATWLPQRGSWVLVDQWGWVAGSHGMPRVTRIRLPQCLPSTFLVDGLGVVSAREVVGGWLLLPTGEDAAVADEVELVLSDDSCVFSTGGAGTHLSGRRAAILACLADHPDGLSGGEVGELVYGRDDALVAVRAEISRINRVLGRVISARPYRLAREVRVIDQRRGA